MSAFIFALILSFGFPVSDNVYAVPFELVSECSVNDQEYAYILIDEGVLAGDQDGNGLIDGDDCNWR